MTNTPAKAGIFLPSLRQPALGAVLRVSADKPGESGPVKENT